MKQTELQLDFELNSEGADHIDLAQCYSLVNRISCRQGMQYAVSGITVTSSIDSTFSIYRLWEHWPCINAWEKGYHAWRRSQDQVLDLEPGIEARYRDFKIFMDDQHQTAGVTGNLIPSGYQAGNFGLSDDYDWEASEIQIPYDPATTPAPEAYNLHMSGASTVTSKGLITGYAASRARPAQVEPNLVDSSSTEDWIRESMDVGEDLEEIRQNIEDFNDEPPYVVGAPGSAHSFYPGGMHQGIVLPVQKLFTRSGVGTQTRTGPMTVPCGLLKVASTGSQGTVDALLTVHLMPGEYKGAMARPMQEVN